MEIKVLLNTYHVEKKYLAERRLMVGLIPTYYGPIWENAVLMQWILA
jgi:hypothetical protein